MLVFYLRFNFIECTSVSYLVSRKIQIQSNNRQQQKYFPKKTQRAPLHCLSHKIQIQTDDAQQLSKWYSQRSTHTPRIFSSFKTSTKRSVRGKIRVWSKFFFSSFESNTIRTLGFRLLFFFLVEQKEWKEVCLLIFNSNCAHYNYFLYTKKKWNLKHRSKSCWSKSFSKNGSSRRKTEENLFICSVFIENILLRHCVK